MLYIYLIYIRATKKQRSPNSKIFYQYSLAQTFRVDEKVKQRSILYLGSSPLMADKKTIHLRKPSKPIEQVYNATKCIKTQTAIKKYVVYH